jgi:hypothetical protein
MQHETNYSRSGAESADHSPGTGVETPELLDDSVESVPPIAAVDERSEVSSPPDDDHVEPAEAGTVPAFLHEIARQMQAAVDRERGRIAAEATNSLDEHVQKVRTRASIEADELKRLAEEDVGRIHEWSAAESERLRRETESRIGARRGDLERHLRQHDDLVEREISGASKAVEEYQAELDRFVGRLAGEREPTEIAQLASLLPEPPHVEEIASAARADAIAELARSEAATDVAAAGLGLVGVMDPGAISHTADSKAPETVPDQLVDVSSEEAQADQVQQRRILGARNRVDLAIRLVLVVGLVALVATLVFLVVTGQISVSTTGGPSTAA